MLRWLKPSYLCLWYFMRIYLFQMLSKCLNKSCSNGLGLLGPTTSIEKTKWLTGLIMKIVPKSHFCKNLNSHLAINLLVVFLHISIHFLMISYWWISTLWPINVKENGCCSIPQSLKRPLSNQLFSSLRTYTLTHDFSS